MCFGLFYKRFVVFEDDEVDVEVVFFEKSEKKEEEMEDKGYMIKLWK